MSELLPLWLPIVLSAFAVWILATIAWTALPHHRRDYVALPDEARFSEFLRAQRIPPGNYVFPDFRGREAMKSASVARQLEQGPVGHLSVWTTPLTMADKMIGTLVLHLVVSVLVAYLARTALPGAASSVQVFRIAGTGGVLAYAFAFVPSALWFGAYRRAIVASVVDGVAFGLLTGAIFAWLWPA